MFDPTIFDNLKVVLEGLIYELDADGEIQLTDRKDLIDLSRMDRCAVFSFKKPRGLSTATILIKASTETLSKELLGHSPDLLTNEIKATFNVLIHNPESDCEGLLFILNKAFRSKRTKIIQTITQEYGPVKKEMYCHVSLHFLEGINEKNFDQLEALCAGVLYALERMDHLSVGIHKQKEPD